MCSVGDAALAGAGCTPLPLLAEGAAYAAHCGLGLSARGAGWEFDTICAGCTGSAGSRLVRLAGGVLADTLGAAFLGDNSVMLLSDSSGTSGAALTAGKHGL